MAKREQTDRPSGKALERVARGLFPDESDRARFVMAVDSGDCRRQGVIWLNARPLPFPFRLGPRPGWLPDFADLLDSRERPGSHELHESGALYSLDGSSIFEAASLMEIPIDSPRVLDLCASPGGKSVFAWRRLRPSQLIANEVIGKRSAALISNLERCNVSASVVRADVSVLAERWPQAFDVVIVDAPCSGQSLVARGQKAPGCFHPSTVNRNSNRQKRVLGTAAGLVAGGGFLAYMTCTYSPEENERVIEWFLKRYPEFMALPVRALVANASNLTDVPAYRLFPEEGFGAGGFCALLQNTSDRPRREVSTASIRLREICPRTALRRLSE